MSDIITDGFVAPDGQVFIYRDGRLPNAPAADGRMLTSEGGAMLWQKGDVSRLDGVYYPNAVSDYDGNWYDAVVIGDKVWMVQNLRTTHFADGTAIAAGGTGPSTPYYYNYDESSIPLKNRGLLYNWAAVMNGSASSELNPSGVQGIAPDGWHVPSKAEFEELIDYVNSQKRYLIGNHSGKSLASTSGWNSSSANYAIGKEQEKNNLTCFSLFAAGDARGSIHEMSGSITQLYSSTEYDTYNVYTLYAEYNRQDVNIHHSTASFDTKYYGRSVRCVCDMNPADFRKWYIGQYGNQQHMLNTIVYCTLTRTGNNSGTVDMSGTEIYKYVSQGAVVALKDGDYVLFCEAATSSGMAEFIGFTGFGSWVHPQKTQVVILGTTATIIVVQMQELLVGSGDGQNIKTFENESILGSGDISVTKMLYASGTRIMLDTDGIHDIELTDYAVTVVNFAAEVTSVTLNFQLDALGDRQVILKRAPGSSSVTVSIQADTSYKTKRLSLVATGYMIISGDAPRAFAFSNRLIDDDTCMITAVSFSNSNPSFGSSVGATWTPPTS